MDQQTRWRLGLGLSVVAIIVLVGFWASSPNLTPEGFLAISIPVVVLLYAGSYCAAQAYMITPAPEAGLRTRDGSRRWLSVILILAGFGSLAAAGITAIVLGAWTLGLFALAIAGVFLAGGLPPPFTTKRIIVIVLGLVAASVIFLM